MGSFANLYNLLDANNSNMNEIKAYIRTISLNDDPTDMHLSFHWRLTEEHAIEILNYLDELGFPVYTQEMWDDIRHRPKFLAIWEDYYNHGFIPDQQDLYTLLDPVSWSFFKYTHDRFPQISLYVEGTPFEDENYSNNFSRKVLMYYNTKWGKDRESVYDVSKYLFENGDTPCADDGGFIEDLTKWKTSFGPKTINKLYKLALSQPCVRSRPDLLYLVPKEMRDEMAVQLFEKGRILLDIPGFDAWTIEEILSNLEEMNGVSLEHARHTLMEMAQRYSRIKLNK